MNIFYLKWLESITHSALKEESLMVLPDELQIQSLWYQGLFGSEFTTTEGQAVKIHYLGEWNHGAGPDFKECLLSIDGKEQKGAVEIDLTPVHWELHGHAVNPAFNDVILHVSFAPSHATAFCRNSEYKNIPQVSVSQDALSKALPAKASKISDTIPGFCASSFLKWSEDEINTLLAASANHRLSLKAKRLGEQLNTIGLKETLWQALATTLGYSQNHYALKLLSQRIKGSTLKALPKPKVKQAVMLGTAGFLSPELYISAPQETQKYLQELWKDWWKERDMYELSPDRKIPWTKGNQRPVNHPHRRVASLAILHNSLEKLTSLMRAPSEQSLQTIKDILLSHEDDFWSQHYTLTSKKSERKMTLFGTDKCNEFLINFLIPLWYLKAPVEAFTYYTKLKSSSKNNEVKRALKRLFQEHPSSHTLARFKYQEQGLQQLYQDFCLRSGCLKCQLPKITHYKHHPSTL